MNYHKITKNDIANGEGVGVVLWVSGCTMRCKGCHNIITWAFNSGHKFTDDTMCELLEALDKPYISRLTLSGGHPLETQNIKQCTDICMRVKRKFPDKTIWLYTGYTMAEIKNLPILNYVDVIVDGEYQSDKRDISLKFRGSSNQKIWRKGSDGTWTE